MKTLIIKEITDGTRTCDFCHAEEGKLRPIGRFKLKLKTVDVFGTKKQACQSCAHKNKTIRDSRKGLQEIQVHDMGLIHLKKFISLVVHACFLVLFFSAFIYAQPGLPSAPSQAPIDGGLGLLAAAGGAYAIKKLRGKNSNQPLD